MFISYYFSRKTDLLWQSFEKTLKKLPLRQSFEKPFAHESKYYKISLNTSTTKISLT